MGRVRCKAELDGVPQGARLDLGVDELPAIPLVGHDAVEAVG